MLPALHRPGAGLDQIDQLFDDLGRNFDGLRHHYGFPTIRGLPRPGVIPPLEVSERDDGYSISVELPGISREDVNVSVEDDSLVVKGEKRSHRNEKDENGETHTRERAYGSFRRELRLPDIADRDNVTANYDNGVLTVFVPKRESQKSHVKQVEVG